MTATEHVIDTNEATLTEELLLEQEALAEEELLQEQARTESLKGLGLAGGLELRREVDLDEVFEIRDFTAVSPFEKLSRELELIAKNWSNHFRDAVGVWNGIQVGELIAKNWSNHFREAVGVWNGIQVGTISGMRSGCGTGFRWEGDTFGGIGTHSFFQGGCVGRLFAEMKPYPQFGKNGVSRGGWILALGRV